MAGMRVSGWDWLNAVSAYDWIVNGYTFKLHCVNHIGESDA